MALHPAQKRINKKKSAETTTATTTTPNKSERVRKKMIGTNAIHTMQSWANRLKPYELRFPHNIETYHEMYSRDEAVGGVLNATYALVENAFSSFKMIPDSASPESVKIANLLTYYLNNMSGDGTMRTFARNAATFNQFGFSVIEKSYKPFIASTYSKELPAGVKLDDLWMIDRLRMIPQRSLDNAEPFIIGDQGRDILGIKQSSIWFSNSTQTLKGWVPPSESVTIRRNKLMLMGMNITDSNPMGVSPLEQVWNSYKQKVFFQNYQSVGVLA